MKISSCLHNTALLLTGTSHPILPSLPIASNILRAQSPSQVVQDSHGMVEKVAWVATEMYLNQL